MWREKRKKSWCIHFTLTKKMELKLKQEIKAAKKEKFLQAFNIKSWINIVEISISHNTMYMSPNSGYFGLKPYGLEGWKRRAAPPGPSLLNLSQHKPSLGVSAR